MACEPARKSGCCATYIKHILLIIRDEISDWINKFINENAKIIHKFKTKKIRNEKKLKIINYYSTKTRTHTHTQDSDF